MKPNNQAVAFTLVAVASWSTVASAFKIALREMSYFELILMSSLTALLIFALVLTFQRKWHLLKKLDKKVWIRFAFVGALNPATYYLVLFKSYSLLPAQIAQPINYFWPILLVVLLALLLKERIPTYKYLGMIVSFAGVALISLGTESIAGVKLSETGIMLAFFSAFLWAIFWIVNRKTKDVDGTLSLFLSFLFGVLYLGVASIFVPVGLHSPLAVLSGVYVGTFEMAIPFIFFGMALRRGTNPALVNQLCYLSPFISLFIIHAVLGETIYFTTYIGLLLIVAGILLNEILSKKIVDK